MKWSKAAEEAVSRVPFFVRKRVRRKVEEEAERSGAGEVQIRHVEACRKRFLNNMEEEVKGFTVETCFGSGGCPNRAAGDSAIAQKLEKLLSQKNLKAFLKERVQGPLKMHHEFRVSLSDCPNGCSRPQIVDVGLLGACRPEVAEEPCAQCGACVQICREDAIHLPEGAEGPILHEDRCLACGQCLRVCPTGTLKESLRGYRILVGGKLGRHPQLGKEIGGIHSEEETLRIIERILEHYMEHNRIGERLGEILNRAPFE